MTYPIYDPSQARTQKTKAQCEYRARNRETINARRRDKAARKQSKKFVAIDSEGVSFGDKIDIESGQAQKQRTILWGAASEAEEPIWLAPTLARKDPFCTTEQICDWLLSLPEYFGKDCIYVWFGSSYDATQIIADLPFAKAWEVQHGKPFRTRNDASDSAAKSQMGRYVFYGRYAFSYLKQKYLRIGLLRNPDRPRHPGTGKLEFIRTITIFDVFGFFQTSFLKAATSIPGAMTDAEYAIIQSGKGQRGEFTIAGIRKIQKYTRCELIVLARMMERLRTTLEDNGLKLSRWQGAGAIAQAMFKQYGVRNHLRKVETRDLPIEQEWAHRAFFGGRIELLKQGITKQKLYSYDVRSAYPFHQHDLSSMANGGFRKVENVSRETIANANRLSMFELYLDCDVETSNPILLNSIHGAVDGPQFYPLPYRDERGRITYPPQAHGVYMKEEALAAFEWLDYQIAHYRSLGIAFPGKLAICAGYVFETREDTKPFFFLKNKYDFRRSIKQKEKETGVYDLTEKVVKLGVNSAYGKTSQSVGSRGKAPSSASPWYAAAITAGTRAQLIRAALTAKPGSIVAFQTDGIVATQKLQCEIGEELGQWEEKTIEKGALFLQPGVYIQDEKPKHRGIKPDLLGEPVAPWLTSNCRDGWANGLHSFSFPYRYYVTLGAAVASEERWKLAGYWVDGMRELYLNNLGHKRLASPLEKERRKRAVQLVDTKPLPAYFMDADFNSRWHGNMSLSQIYLPEWLDTDFALEQETDMLNEEIAATNGEGRYDECF